MLEYIQTELSQGQLLGPFLELPHSSFISMPLGVVPKKEPGYFRVIHDLSFPIGCSVTDLISNNLSAVSYADFYYVVSLIVSQGVGVR